MGKSKEAAQSDVVEKTPNHLSTAEEEAAVLRALNLAANWSVYYCDGPDDIGRMPGKFPQEEHTGTDKQTGITVRAFVVPSMNLVKVQALTYPKAKARV